MLTDGTDQEPVAPNAITFTMPTKLAFGSSYTVTVATQPVGELCTVTGGTGTIPAGPVSSVAVACSGWVWQSGADVSSSPNTAPVQGVYGSQGTPAAGNVPGARDSAMTWKDSQGRFWMLGGTGIDGGGVAGELGDMWMYDPTIQQWTWESGTQAANVAPSYGTLGVPALSNHPGARHASMIWTDSSGNLWLYGGIGYDSTTTATDQLLADMWMYDPVSHLWTFEGGTQGLVTVAFNGVYGTQGVSAASNSPGARAAASTWTDSSGRFWMFGGLYSSSGVLSYFNDMWVYDPSTQLWTWVSGTDQINQNGVGTLGTPSVNNEPGARFAAATWQDSSGNFWLFGGSGYDLNGDPSPSVISDVWMFNPTNLTWTWEAGPSSGGITGTYGTQGTPAAGNIPGARYSATAWTDSAGQVWVFGGNGVADTGTTLGLLNELWNFNPTTLQWTFVSGGKTTNDVNSASYGTIGTPAPGNVPGDRAGASGWVDSSGNLWMFGGFGYDSTQLNFGELNDFWMF
jgi:hypothetical protein